MSAANDWKSGRRRKGPSFDSVKMDRRASPSWVTAARSAVIASSAYCLASLKSEAAVTHWASSQAA